MTASAPLEGAIENSPLRGVRIMMLLPSLGLGGAERQGFLLAKHLLLRHGAAVQLVGIARFDAMAEHCDAIGLPYRFFELHHRYRSRLGHFSDLWRFMSFLRRERIQVLLPYCMFQNVLGALTWRGGGVKVCIWNQRDEGRSRLERWIERIAVSQIRRFISNSNHGADFLIKELRVSPDRVDVVPNGIEFQAPPARSTDWRTGLGLPPDAILASMVANLHGKKDHATLIAAWRHVVDARLGKGQAAPHLLLAGSDGDQSEALRQQVEELSLSTYVHFLGEVRDTPSLLEEIDLAVFSSFAEGIPNAVLEAMARGQAVVATDYPGIREAVGPVGFQALAQPRNAEDFAAKVLRVLDDVKLREQLGREGQARVADVFGLERMGSAMSRIIISEWKRATDGRSRRQYLP